MSYYMHMGRTITSMRPDNTKKIDVLHVILNIHPCSITNLATSRKFILIFVTLRRPSLIHAYMHEYVSHYII